MEDIDREVALGVLERGEVAHVAVSDADGPYVSPLSYAVVGDHVVFLTMRGRRYRALLKDPRVCVEVYETTDGGGWRSVVVEAEAEIVTGSPLHTDALQGLMAKYAAGHGALLGTSRAPGPDLTEVVAVPLTRVSGRSSGEGTHPRTRPGRL